MVSVEFTGEDGRPDPLTAKTVRRACLAQNLRLLTCGSYGNVIRWIPPLIVTAGQINEALGIFATALSAHNRTYLAAQQP